MKKKIKYGVLLALLVTASIYAFREADKHYEENKERQLAFKYLKDFSNVCLQKFPAKSDSQKIVSLRHCVFINTVFSTDKKYTPLWSDNDRMASWLLNYASNKRKDPPPMECSNRAGTLVAMLQTQGYDSHDFVVARNEDNFDDHVVTEVLNPDTNKWEVQGPSYDVEYVSLKDRHTLSLKEMLSMDTKEYEPCNFEGKCGWYLKTSENTELSYNRGYWNVVWVKAEKTLYVSKRFDENKPRPVYGKNLSYCEWRAKWCKNVVHLD